ncbi:MAG: sodium-dependent transporter, partial [Planctomycetota bacterium]
MADTQTIKQRESWGSRAAFVLAAIGSAVGLGNLWGFPYKLYAYGGGAFLIPYFIAMVVIGLPLLIMEFAVGHWAQNSAPGSFARILRRHRFVGWWLSLLAFVIITYYVVILAYCTIYLWHSLGGMFGASVPWAHSADAAGQHFASVHAAGESGGPHWPVVLGSLVTWLLIYFCLFRGVRWVSKVVLLTVPLPWLMLVVLTVRGLTLEGSQTGLSFYLDPDWSKLAVASTWQMAFGQVFFTLSLGFAVMLSYASFLHRRSDLNNNAAIIALGDLATSFVAGLAVFGTLGALAFTQGEAVEEVVSAGPGLAFVSFPYALAQLPEGVAVFSFIFFIAL